MVVVMMEGGGGEQEEEKVSFKATRFLMGNAPGGVILSDWGAREEEA